MHDTVLFSFGGSAELTAWLVTVVLVIAAWIDGARLKVPNWLTFPFVLTGLCYSAWLGGFDGFSASLLGTVVGFLLLLPLLAVGGMGTGDVKLLMGIGAWLHTSATWNSFCLTALIGGVLALILVAFQGGWLRHGGLFWQILREFFTVRNPERLSERAAERKPSMLLLPYGIPMAMGTITYLWWIGDLV